MGGSGHRQRGLGGAARIHDNAEVFDKNIDRARHFGIGLHHARPAIMQHPARRRRTAANIKHHLSVDAGLFSQRHAFRQCRDMHAA